MKTMVKILAVSDVHGDMDKVDVGDAEIVIVAGDICKDQKHRVGEHKSKISKSWARDPKTIEWFQDHPDVRFYILPGNHDRFAKHRDDRKLFRKMWPDNVKLINDKGYIDESGLTIWGMPWNPGNPEKRKGRGTFTADAEKIQRECLKIAKRFKCLDILVTHAPPRVKGTDMDSSDWHISPILARMLEKLNPKLLICGHKHELSHVPFTTNSERTTVVNVAMKKGHKLIDDGGHFDYKPREIVATVEHNVTFEMDKTSDMIIR